MGLFGREDKPLSNRQPQGGRTEGPTLPTPPGPGGTTVISERIVIDGTIDGDGKVLVEGRVKGKIDGRGTVAVAPRGRIEASLHARVVIVSGRVTGNISADDRIELEATADVTGDLEAPRIVIKDGAIVNGQVTMRGPKSRGNPTPSSARKNRAR